MSNLGTLAWLFETGGIELCPGPLFDETPPGDLVQVDRMGMQSQRGAASG